MVYLRGLTPTHKIYAYKLTALGSGWADIFIFASTERHHETLTEENRIRRLFGWGMSKMRTTGWEPEGYPESHFRGKYDGETVYYHVMPDEEITDYLKSIRILVAKGISGNIPMKYIHELVTDESAR